MNKNGLYYYAPNKWCRRGQYFLVEDGWIMMLNDISNTFWPVEPLLSPLHLVLVSRINMTTLKRVA